MKQAEDQATIEMTIRAKRGRPATGRARTASQRKADQRARDMEKACEAGDNVGDITDSGLIALLSLSSKPGWTATGLTAKSVWEELGKRRGFIA